VGVEITDDAVELPRFRHPTRAAYVFGAERFSLSPEVLAACEFVVKIPTRFSINVGMAGAIVLYDRMLTMGGFGDRPVKAGGKGGQVPPPHIWGAPLAKPRA
jgi:tRNA(Leu) C34 or U34 (ribose-2'-O)-methylase TrmL